MRLGDIPSLLRENGFRITPQRTALLRVITGSRDRFTPATIYERAKRYSPTIGIVTVYRMLDALDRIGLICRVHAADDCRSYLIKRPTGHHHHLVCTSCGRVVDVLGCNIGELENKVARNTGFKISSHVLEFEGTCETCVTKAPAHEHIPATVCAGKV